MELSKEDLKKLTAELLRTTSELAKHLAKSPDFQKFKAEREQQKKKESTPEPTSKPEPTPKPVLNPGD